MRRRLSIRFLMIAVAVVAVQLALLRAVGLANKVFMLILVVLGMTWVVLLQQRPRAAVLCFAASSVIINVICYFTNIYIHKLMMYIFLIMLLLIMPVSWGAGVVWAASTRRSPLRNCTPLVAWML